MNTRTSILLIMLFVIVTAFIASGIEIEYITWINPDYNEKAQYAKIIRHISGTIYLFEIVTDTEPKYQYQGTLTLNKEWYDSTGNLWEKLTFTTTGGRTFYVLIKHIYEPLYALRDINKVNSVIIWHEVVWSEVDYPDEMSPTAGNYAIYYFQE